MTTATMTTYPSSVRDHARKTADEIRRRGWVQGVLVYFTAGHDTYDDCKVCLVGALRAADGQNPALPDRPNSRQMSNLIGVLHQELAETEDEWLHDEPSYFVAKWNDRTGRTEAEVLDVLDRIAGTR